MENLLKYPRTPHIQGSRLQPGDEDLDQVHLSDLPEGEIVIEEKVDGANSAISFNPAGELLLQSRGHYLTGGPWEKQFTLFKSWAATHRDSLFHILGQKHVMYGEWVYAKHTIYYDRLPHFFLEFDIFDCAEGVFLGTRRRQVKIGDAPVESVEAITTRSRIARSELESLVKRSAYKSSNWKQTLKQHCHDSGLDPMLVLSQTDDSDLMEGLYIKVERHGRVIGRYKWVRRGFHTSVMDSGNHWLDRPIIPNRLQDGSDIYSG